MSEQEQQPQTQNKMIDNGFQYNSHSDLLQIHSEEQEKQSHYTPNHDENGQFKPQNCHFEPEKGSFKPFAVSNMQPGGIQQQIEQ